MSTVCEISQISKHTYLCFKLYIQLLDDDINSYSSLSYDRSKASSKTSSPHSAIQSFLLHMRVSSPFLKVIQQLPTSSSSSSSHFYPHFYLSFNNLFQKAVSTLNMTNPVILPFNYTRQQNLTFFFGTRGKISNPNRTSNAELKYVSSFSPSPMFFFVTGKLIVKVMCIFTYYIHYSPYLKCEGC